MSRQERESHARARLEFLDARIEALPHGALSLSPDRRRATPISSLVERESRGETDVFGAIGSALADLVEAALLNFPGNLFWDFDYLAASLAAEARGSQSAGAGFLRRAHLVRELMHVYGSRSPIRFAYVHDFSYGFDWARWVRRRPHERARTGPFALDFLEYSERRGYEILELVAHDDARYPRLPADAQARNVFLFSREPADEIALLRDLAGTGLVPVEAWRHDAEPEWRHDFVALRERRARELGLPASIGTKAPVP